MGAADVVPGVSGGTIAFISGIYLRLLNAIRSINISAVKVLFSDGVVSAWRHIDGTFLLALGAGIAISVLSLARVIRYCLEAYPTCVWGFFFGLILASSVFLGRQVKWQLPAVIMLVVGVVAALFVAEIRPTEIEATTLTIFFSGAFAICAMILPGISGSFILLIIGMYPLVLDAIHNLDLAFIAIFGSGCAVGLLAFSHVLAYLLERFEHTMLALLTGFLAGSLMMVWPWQHVVETYTKDDGRVVTLQKDNVLPSAYAELTQQDPLTLVVVGLAVLGVCLVFGLALVSREKT